MNDITSFVYEKNLLDQCITKVSKYLEFFGYKYNSETWVPHKRGDMSVAYNFRRV